jgi:hypothetical protein
MYAHVNAYTGVTAHGVCQVEYEYSTGKYSTAVGRVTDAEGVHLMQQGRGAPTPEEDSLPVFTLGTVVCTYLPRCHFAVAQRTHLQLAALTVAVMTHCSPY